jgi:DNA-binding response OmpR family regulator
MIDDDESIVQLYIRFLNKTGHKTIGVDNLPDALKELANQPYDVVLVDLNIPGSNGVSIITAIREAGYTMPAIVLSGAVYNVDLPSLESLGVISAVEKSSDMQPLLMELGKLLSKP